MLKPFFRRFVLVFFDDILVFSKDWSSHLKHLEVVLGALRHNHFVANEDKCSFGKGEVEYLGHIISREGVPVDPTKVQSVLDWPTSTNVKGVRGFLGLTGYYCRFIMNYGKLAKP